MNRTLVVGLSLALVIAVEWWLYTLVVDATKTEMMEEQIKLIEKARVEERELQENANHELQKQVDAKSVIADNLAADIERLRRERPTRPSVPPTPRATCEGADGTELAFVHAKFLTEFAALAAKQDTALATCYAVYDAGRDSLPR